VTFESLKQLYAELPEDHDPSSRAIAFERALDTTRLWTGVFYQEERPTLHNRLDDLNERAGRYENLKELLDKFK
jgi:hypothetical protein